MYWYLHPFVGRAQLIMSKWQLHWDAEMYRFFLAVPEHFLISRNAKALEIHLCLISNNFFYESTNEIFPHHEHILPKNITWDSEVQLHVLCVNIYSTCISWYCFWNGGETATTLDLIIICNIQEMAWSQPFFQATLSIEQHE